MTPRFYNTGRQFTVHRIRQFNFDTAVQLALLLQQRVPQQRWHHFMNQESPYSECIFHEPITHSNLHEFTCDN
jgi:hypothetical protein